ncbi:MAG: glycosyltransferase family 2 protein [Lachnospiraceae bacterium]|nr:glycosyltransferase family 2 protein [Lachnospiraceae bacterium]
MTISVCMIVKNEEKNLAGCLDCLTSIADEIIIVDTGSADGTKEIANKYTDKVYDFEWVDDFSAARNFAFSKASMDYIYSADADERLDKENQAKFLQLKEILLPEIEIVQMYYCNQLENNTIYSFDKEYRPKLYKRLREFVWREKIHEAVTLSPIVYDSDIEIIHKPHGNHGGRDLQIFAKMVANGETISKRLREIYAKELFIAGKESDFVQAEEFFKQWVEEAADEDELKQAACVLARYYRTKGDNAGFFKYALKVTVLGGCSEMCCEIGQFYYDCKDYAEAAMWFYNAANETEALLSLAYKEEIPNKRLEEINSK